MGLALGSVGAVGEEIFQWDDGQHRFMACFQDNGRSDACLEGFLPTGRAQAPAVPGAKPGKMQVRPRGDEIIAPGKGKAEELVSNNGADTMDAIVLTRSGAPSIAFKASTRLHSTGLECSAEHVTGRDRLSRRHEAS